MGIYIYKYIDISILYVLYVELRYGDGVVGCYKRLTTYGRSSLSVSLCRGEGDERASPSLRAAEKDVV